MCEVVGWLAGSLQLLGRAASKLPASGMKTSAHRVESRPLYEGHARRWRPISSSRLAQRSACALPTSDMCMHSMCTNANMALPVERIVNGMYGMYGGTVGGIVNRNWQSISLSLLRLATATFPIL